MSGKFGRQGRVCKQFTVTISDENYINLLCLYILYILYIIYIQIFKKILFYPSLESKPIKYDIVAVMNIGKGSSVNKLDKN